MKFAQSRSRDFLVNTLKAYEGITPLILNLGSDEDT